MKKYILGTITVILAIGFSAFSANKNGITFVFIGSIEAQLENPDYWVLQTYDPYLGISCNYEGDETCSILFDDEYYNQASDLTRNIGPGINYYKLRSDLTIYRSGDNVLAVFDTDEYEIVTEPNNNTNLVIEEEFR